jgi:hypothetical protein
VKVVERTVASILPYLHAFCVFSALLSIYVLLFNILSSSLVTLRPTPIGKSLESDITLTPSSHTN